MLRTMGCHIDELCLRSGLTVLLCTSSLFKLEPCADVTLVGGARGVGGQKCLFKDSRKISFYPQNFRMTFFSHRKLQQNKYTATMASTACRQIIGGGGAGSNSNSLLWNTVLIFNLSVRRPLTASPQIACHAFAMTL